MTVQERKESTRSKILRVSMRMFLEVGYTATTVKAVCDELNISKGNFTFYFPTKEYVLAELVRMLCEFQEKLIDYEADRGVGSVLSICIELMTVAAACEENEIARDFFVSAFQSRMCLDYLKKEYKITPEGREILKCEILRLTELLENGARILEGESEK